MPAKMMSDMPLPMPRSVICSPSHMMNAVPVVSVSTRHQPEAPARVVDERQAAGDLRLALEEDRDAERLHDAQQDRAVARVLRDLAAAELAFLRQPLEVRPDDRQQLQDDRRADVRHDAEREDRHLRQVAAREHVVEAEHRVLRLRAPSSASAAVFDAGRRDVAARRGTPPSSAEREQHAVAQLRDGEDVLQAVVHTSYASRLQPIASAVPPAAAIFSAALPLNLCARTVSALAISPRASTLTGRRALLTRPALAQQLRRHDRAGVEHARAVSRFTTAYSTRNGLWKPRFGTRRCSGIWPPSNPRLKREARRDFAPLWPRAGGLAVARALAAADALLRVLRALRRA